MAADRVGRVLPRPFLDIRGKVKDTGVGDEQGMLSAAFPPDYPESGRLYVAYTDRRGDLDVVEYQRSQGSDLRADRSSARPLLTIGEPTTKHHAGLLPAWHAARVTPAQQLKTQ